MRSRSASQSVVSDRAAPSGPDTGITQRVRPKWSVLPACAHIRRYPRVSVDMFGITALSPSRDTQGCCFFVFLPKPSCWTLTHSPHQFRPPWVNNHVEVTLDDYGRVYQLRGEMTKRLQVSLPIAKRLLVSFSSPTPDIFYSSPVVSCLYICIFTIQFYWFNAVSVSKSVFVWWLI